MYKAEIKTDAGTYEVTIQNVTDIQAAWKEVEDTLAAYMPFVGEHELIVIAIGASIKHIRVWDPEKLKPVMATDQKKAEGPKTVYGVFDWETNATYLGQKFKISGVGYRGIDLKVTYMAVTIDGAPAAEALDTNKLNEILGYWRDSEGDSPGTYHIYHAPGSLILAPEDAGSFLLEAVGPNATGYTTENKTAKALPNWKGDA